MKITDLQKLGAFVENATVPKTIVWKREVDGKEVEDSFKCFVRKLSVGEATDFYSSIGDKQMCASVIAHYVRGAEKGNEPLLTYEQAYQLDPELARLFIEAVNEVTTPKKIEPTDVIWHELVLNGVGGCTIAEAKQVITEEEFNQWVQYRNIYGSLNPTVSINARGGELAYITQAVQGGKGRYHDFVPTYASAGSEPQSTLEEAMKEWK